jgi:hypothetical protein
MSGRTITALALAAAVAAGLTLSCSGGAVEPGELFQGSGTVEYFTFEGGFWAIDGDDGTVYEPTADLPPGFEKAGLRVGFVARMTAHASVHMAGPVVELRDIWVLGSRIPR